MTTRLELRTSVRRRLEDTGAVPVWDDATLNDLIGDAIRRYGARSPAERSVTVVVGAGAQNVPVTPALAAEAVVRVLTPAGEVVARMISPLADGEPAPGQAWRWWNGTLLLATGAEAGAWQIDYLGARTLPVDDISAVEVIAGDEEIVVLMTAAAALRRRAVEDGKRGTQRGTEAISAVAEALDREAEARMRSRKRRVRGGHLTPYQ